MLSYIFTGRESLSATDDEIGQIVRKCTAHGVANRYQAVRELIADVERLTDPQAA